MRRTKEAAAATREALLKAAIQVFSTKGYAATTLDDIASAASVTRGAVYWHFGGKPELYNALINELFTDFRATLEQVIGQPGPPLATLRRVMTRSLELLEDDSNYRAALELNLFKAEQSPELMQASGFEGKEQTNNALYELTLHLVQAGITTGEVRHDLKPEIVTIAALGLVTGTSFLWLQNPAQFSIKKAAIEIVETFLRGITY